ncbi:MAG: choice-of-anchor D domain-containing protein [bacterium]
METIKFFFALFFLSVSSICSQNLTIINLSTTDFPKLKVGFYAFDDEGRLIKDLKKEDFSVIEDGINREVTFLSCPDFEQPEALSSVLVIDNSSSMRGYRLQLAKNAAKAWVNALPQGKSECAISSFNDNGNILTDFTTDRNKLIAAINSLYYVGNTNYNAALLDAPSGGVKLAKNGKYKRVLVFLTDGQPNFFPEQEQIIEEALENDIVIYCVTLYMPAPNCIKQFSERTGGEWFENVSTIGEAEEIYRKILLKVLLDKPCELEWISDTGCNVTVREPIISDTFHLISAKKKYIIPAQNRTYLKINPSSCRFPYFVPGVKYDTIITISAINADFRDIETDLNIPFFELSPKKFSLNKGESIDLKLTFHCSDTLFRYKKIKFSSSDCSSELYVSGGDFTSFGNENTLRVTHPNGKEVFLVGLDTMITWEGVTPDDTVQIDYSFDNGINWKTITTNGSGLKYSWDTIPNTPSNRCIMRVKKISGNSYYSVLGYGLIRNMEYSPDGLLLALASSSGHIFLINPETGDLIKSFFAHDTKGTITASGVSSICFNNDGTKLASSGNDGKIKIWDIALGKAELEIKAGYQVESISFNPEGTMLVSGGSGKLLHLWSTETGDSIQSFVAHPTGCAAVKFSPNGSVFASGGADGKVMVWNINEPSLNNTYTGHSAKVNCLDFSRDSTRLISGSTDRTVRLWELSTKKLIKTLYSFGYVYSAKFTPDGKKIINGSSDKMLNMFEGETGNSIASYPEENYYAVAISPDGNVVACGEQNNITIKNIEYGIDSLIFSRGHRGRISYLEMSTDNKTMGTVGADTTIKIWDADTKKIVRTIPLNNIVRGFGMDAKAQYVAALLRISSTESLVNIWETSTGNIIRALPDTDGVWCTIAVSPDGNLAACGYKQGGRVDLINIKTGITLRSLYDDAKTDTIISIAFSSDGRRIISSSKDKIFVWDVNGGKFIGSINATTNYSLFSPTLETFASIGKNLELWNFFTGAIVNQIPNNDNIASISYSPDGIWLSTAANGTVWNKTTNVKLWEGETGYLVESLPNYLYNTNCTKFFPDGTKAAFGTDDGSIMLWHLNSLTKLTDNSDTLWSIVMPVPKSQDVYMGDVIVGSSKDSLVMTFIMNEGTYPVSVESITFSAADSSNFELVSGYPPYVIQPGDSMAVEFRFKPDTVGQKWSWIRIKTKSKTISQRIFGRGVDMKVELINDKIDFGKVKIGEFKDTTVSAVIRNLGTAPVNFTNSYHYIPNDVDFTTLKGAAPFTLNGGEEVELTLRFTPSFRGKTSGNIIYEFDAPNSPMYVQLFGEGYELIPSITASGNRRINLICENEFLDSIKLSNTGDTVLQISDLSFSNNKFQFTSNVSNLSIQPGENVTGLFKYSANVPAQDTAQLIILSNAEPDSILVFKYIATKDSAGFISENSIIDFWDLCPNQTADTIITIRNTGTLKNTAKINIPVDFSIFSDNIGLESNESGTILLNFLGMSQEGIFSESLTITDSICGRQTIVELKGRIRKPILEADDMVLSTTVGSFAEERLELRNSSDYDLIIPLEPVITDNQFSIINPQFPMSIPGKQSKFLDIKYEPVDSIAAEIILDFQYEPCDLIKSVDVGGSPVAASVDILTDTIRAKTGEIVEIPIYLRNANNVELTRTTGYVLDFIFNYTLLDPLDYPNSLIVDGKRIVSLEVPKDAGEKDIVAKIRCRVCLGNARETDLEISNYKSKGGIVAVRKQDGKFIISDICEEGGKRLINPEGKAEIYFVAPNPSSGEFNLSINLIETEYTEIYLTNIVGMRVYDVFSGEINKPGEYEFNVNAVNLSSGLYYLILQTPTIRKAEKMVLEK